MARISLEDYCARYKILRDIGKTYDVLLVQENVSGMKSEDPSFIKDMCLQLDGDVDFCLDLKQVYRAQVKLSDMIEAMEDKIVHVHLSDYDDNHDCIVPGAGKRDFNYITKELLGGLSSDTAGLIELYRDGYGIIEDIKDGLLELKLIK